MAAEQDHIHHALNYVELVVADLAASKRFYAAAFGWRFNEYGPEYAGFVDRPDGEKEAGGMRQDPAYAGSGGAGPLVILYSNGLEATRDRVCGAGGTITKAIFAFPGGRRFHFADPSGNELAVWSTG
jgi:predicted enzyme related to lactoylglutathione lyase